MGGPSAPSSSFTPRPLQRTNSNNFTDPRGSYRPAISSSRRAAQAAVSSITHSQAAASDSDEGNDQEISDSEVSNDEEDENDSSTTRLSKDGRITAEHKRVINDLKNGILSSKSADENFPEYSRDLLISSDVTGKTLLHKLIAEYPTIKSSGVTNGMKGRDKASTAVKLCIKLIKWSPEILLAQELRDRETPLYVAFTMASKPSTKPPTRLIQKMLDLTIKRPSIKEALMVPCGTQEETCLHAAVRLSSEELKLVDFILEAKTIAESAEDKITLLRQKDKAGLTPLHYAVSLKFSDVQWQMIQKLTGAEDFPPEIFMDQDKENRTPLHLAAACTNTNLEHILGSSNRTTFADQSVVQRKLVEYIITKAPATLTMTDSTGASPYQYRVTTYPQQTEAISNPKPAHTLAHIRTVPPFETVLPKPMRSYKLNRPDRVPQTPVYGPGEAPGMDLTKVSSTTTSLNPADDDVSFYLIDQYMHLEDQNDTIKYLYGSCPGKFQRCIAAPISFVLGCSSLTMVNREDRPPHKF